MAAAAGKQISRADARIGELRRALGAAADGEARARLRVRLADLLRVHGDAGDAHAELLKAAKEGPDLPAVRQAILSAARALPPAEGADLLAVAGERDGATADPAPVLLEAAAAALDEAGQHVRAAALWLRVAGLDTLSEDRRERAARRAAEAARRAKRPKDELGALRLRLRLGVTPASDRLVLLRRAAALAEGSGTPDDRLTLARAWITEGGDPLVAAALLRGVKVAGDRSADARALLVEVARRCPPDEAKALLEDVPPALAVAGPPPAAAPGLAGAGDVAPTPAPMAAAPVDLLEQALGAARAGQGRRARRLGERALRLGASGADVVARMQSIDSALQKTGAAEDALRLRRTELEGGSARSDAARRQGMEALAVQASAAGLPALAAELRADLGVAPPPAGAPVPPRAAPTSPAEIFRDVQRELARLPPDGDPAPVLPRLRAALAGHPGADAAVALGERILARTAGPQALVDLLAAAATAENEPVRRLRLTRRLADRLAAAGDHESAAHELEQAIERVSGEESVPIRRQRADLLRRLGKDRELGAALERDAAVLRGAERTAALAERAALLEAAGEEDRALDLRLDALRDAPADLSILGAARRRLAETGRERDSLRLALGAVLAEPPPPAAEHARLWRELAVLRERAEGNLVEAAEAWEAALALDPGDAEAAAQAERLWMAIGEWRRAVQLLGRRSARLAEPAERAQVLWRLAELRRTRLGDLDEAVRLYRAIAEVAGGGAAVEVGSVGLRGDLWDDMVRLHAARAVVAPTPVDRARALLDRANLLMQRPERAADAEGDLRLAMELDPRNAEVVSTLERFHESTGDWESLGRLFRRRAEGLPEAEAARLFFGAGRVEERLGRSGAARKAHEKAQRLDPAFREPVTALRLLASGRSDWREVAHLLEVEEKLASGSERAKLLGELGEVLAGRLGDAERATVVLEAATALDPDDLPSLERLTDLYFASGSWERASVALDRLMAAGAAIPQPAARYHHLGEMAEADGQPDKALALFARAYAKDSSHRPTLERLSARCFERGQWDNAWKATEGLLDRYGSDLDADEVVELCVRSALADVHLAQRIGAAGRLIAMLGFGRGWESGVRDIAESWAGMRLEPRLLGALEGERRQRVTSRIAQALTVDAVHPIALQVSAALAMLDERWTDAVAGLERLAALSGEPAAERGVYLEAAGDILLWKKLDRMGGQEAYRRAAALRPFDERLGAKVDDETASSPVPIGFEPTDRVKAR